MHFIADEFDGARRAHRCPRPKTNIKPVILHLCASLCLISACTSVCLYVSISLCVSLCVCCSSLIQRAAAMTFDTGHSLCHGGLSVASHTHTDFVVNSTSTFARRVLVQRHTRNAATTYIVTCIGVARGCSGCTCTPRAVKKIFQALFTGKICKCTP